MSAPVSSHSSPEDSAPRDCCYHCGEAVPANSNYSVTILGENRAMCCPGCRAVATLIADNGLQSFYNTRTAFNERPSPEQPESGHHFDLYDDPDINKGFTRQSDSGNRVARLLIGGISCAACTWLIEQTLIKLPGVQQANVNYRMSRLDVSFDPAIIRLAEIFRRVDALGYQPRPFQASTRREQMIVEHKTGLRQLAVAGLGMMQVGMFGIALHAGDIQGIEPEYQSLLRWVSLIVASFVVLYSARPFFLSAWRHLKVGALVMDFPVSLAIGLAWCTSLWATFTGQGQVYFDSVVMFTFFLLLGRFLERRARVHDELSWFDAESTLPAAVKVLREGSWQDVARQQLQPGEQILIPQGETVAVDATIIEGISSVEESTFNGEPIPREVSSGECIYAGTVNIDSPLQARVTGTFVDTRLAALQRSIEHANTEKPAVARLADRIASRFVAMVLLVTVVTAVVWNFVDPSRALWISLSVLVISCPCALALATPAALTGAANGLRQRGIIVRGENALEALSICTHLVFDKTGTLTTGQLQLTEVRLLSDVDKTEVLRIAASLQAFSRHPLASAFSDFPADIHLEQAAFHVGSGVEGQFNGHSYRIGSMAFCSELAPSLPPSPMGECLWVALCRDREPLAWIGLMDAVRPDAQEVISAATANGLQVELLTGDSSDQGPALAAVLGIDSIQRGVSPQQKMEYVQQLQRQGAVVTMVGDGLNDAPVLGVADASFAIAGATDLARTQADFVLVGGDLKPVLSTWNTARKCRSIIKQNLCWALAYNLCGIPLAAMGYIPPWLAAIGMSLSSLLVVVNSLRLNRRQIH